jgi:SNF family Na+-dependent transporter
MMIVLGVDSMVIFKFFITIAVFKRIIFFFLEMASVESLNTSILDLIPKLKKTHLRKIMTITVICLTCFLCGLIFCTQSGAYWLQIFDSYSGNWAILIVSGLELVSIGWFYGFDNFRKDISTMIGEDITNHVLFNLWRICWTVISPAIVLLLIASYYVNSKTGDLKSDQYIYPYWTKIFGNILTASTLSGVVIWAICLIIDSLFIHKQVFDFKIYICFKIFK